MKRVKDPKLFLSIKTFLTLYLPEIRAKSRNTIKSYRDTLNLFFHFLKSRKNLPLHLVTTEDFSPLAVKEFLDWLIDERHCSSSTRNQRLSCIRTFYGYLAEENMELVDNYSKIQKIKQTPVPDRTLDVILTIDDIRLILKQPNAESKMGLRDQFYMALLYDTGCRNSEILNLRLKDIYINSKGEGSIHVIGKGNKFRATPISGHVLDLFNKYVAVFHPQLNKTQYLFYTVRKGIVNRMSNDNVSRFIKKYEMSAKAINPNLPSLHPHLFRHARAMHLYQAGMPLALVSEWLGHAQLETTLIYANADITLKQKAIEKVVNSNNSVFNEEPFKFENDEDVIKKLYGLAE
ncbi:integrase [Lentibacillus kapialis]|uniref:Integrase n=1 Tax=Lentibacillus kapialis TaxID=340214 RepID=A0A917Q3B5_9BACI|nr:tyrosine-type recombinase/integrase [Lentibacillus kapialis]GGK09392.1 integrase [Lentibacillus kapialis]